MEFNSTTKRKGLLENLAKNSFEGINNATVLSALNAGKVVVLNIYTTSNSDYNQLLCIQKRSDTANFAGSEPTIAQKLTLGWTAFDNSRIESAFQNVCLSKVKNMNGQPITFTIGDVLDEKFILTGNDCANIQVLDTINPQFNKADGTPQDSRKRPDGSELKTAKGDSIYRKGEIVFGAAKHTLLEYVHVKATATVEPEFVPEESFDVSGVRTPYRKG